MLEAFFALVLTAGCNITSVSMGNCGCEDQTAGQFSLCATVGEKTQLPGSTGTSKPKPKPQRLCSYYANGTIDVPTDSIITAWIAVGSRLCIGDEVVQFDYQPPRTIEDDLQDRFQAISDRPFAWWDPGDEIEFEEDANFHLSRKELLVEGSLLGQQASIRFRPVSARWGFSDGGTASGFLVTRQFEKVGNYWAHGFVSYSVDYQIGGGSWKNNVASWELSANPLTVRVVEYPRRSLLVG